jgi:predicted nucleic acid-binding protein
VDEVNATESRTVLASGTVLLAPDLLIEELGSFLRKKILNREMSLADSAEALEVTLERVLLIPSSLSFLRAVEIASSTTGSFYDSFYVALATSLDCQFLTGDKHLINALRPQFLEALLWLGDVSKQT